MGVGDDDPGARLSRGWGCAGWLALSALGWMVAFVAFVAAGVLLIAPSDPPPGKPAAFFDAGGGRIGVALGPSAAHELTHFAVTDESTSFADHGKLVWEIERTGDVPDSWAGPIVIGEVPSGFTETQALHTLPAQWSVRGYGGCSRGLQGSVASVPLRTDRVTSGGGDTESLSAFVARDRAFRPCDPSLLTQPALWVGLVGVAIGVGALVAGGLRARPAPEPLGVYGDAPPTGHSLFEP